MKKIISLLVIMVFVFGLTAAFAENNDTTAANTQELEKIPSPEQIKNFQMIKKIGKDLFGIRKGTSTTPILEKIDHPGLINMFEKIRKIGSALWGIRKKVVADLFIITPETSACVAKAIDVKDKAIMARVTAAALELNTAISTRSSCQQAAVIATTTPRSVLNGCVKTFNEAQKKIKDASNKVQEDSWKIYKDSLKACAVTASSTMAIPMIEDGGNIFN
jgi:hypothetical protein